MATTTRFYCTFCRGHHEVTTMEMIFGYSKCPALQPARVPTAEEGKE